MNVPDIRPPSPQDALRLVPLVQDFATSFPTDRQAFTTSFEALLADPDCDLLCAFGESGVEGYVLAFTHPTFFANGPVTWVEELYVLPALRRLGLARLLMSAVEQRASQRGSRMVALATRRASAFYEAIGYEASATYYRKLLG